MITPELVVVNVADADVVRDVLMRRIDFLKVQKTLRVFHRFTPCSFYLRSCAVPFLQAPVRLYGDNVLVVCPLVQPLHPTPKLNVPSQF